MLEKWVVSWAISFALRQLAKFKNSINWGTVRADLEARIRALIPGDWFDDDVVALMNMALDAVLLALADTANIERVLKALAASDWNGALKALQDLISKVWKPTDARGKLVAEHIASLTLVAA